MAEFTPDEMADFLKESAEKIPLENARTMMQAAGLTRAELSKFTKLLLNKRAGQRQTAGATGHLAKSWKPVFMGSVKGINKAGVYSKLPYAAIHDPGGVVKKKRGGPHLAIPLDRDAEKYPPRGFPRELHFKYASRRAKRNVIGVLFHETGNPENPIKLRYALATQVKLPATYYIKIASHEVAPKLIKLFGDRTIKILTHVR